MIHLSKVFRQKDDNFVRILNQMRLGCLDKTSNRILSGLKRPIHYEDDIYSELYPVCSLSPPLLSSPDLDRI